jgi:hypothetical protein
MDVDVLEALAEHDRRPAETRGQGLLLKSASAIRASSFACRTGALMNDDAAPRSSMACFKWSYTCRSTARTMRSGATAVNRVRGRVVRCSQTALPSTDRSRLDPASRLSVRRWLG